MGICESRNQRFRNFFPFSATSIPVAHFETDDFEESSRNSVNGLEIGPSSNQTLVETHDIRNYFLN